MVQGAMKIGILLRSIMRFRVPRSTTEIAYHLETPGVTSSGQQRKEGGKVTRQSERGKQPP